MLSCPHPACMPCFDLKVPIYCLPRPTQASGTRAGIRHTVWQSYRKDGIFRLLFSTSGKLATSRAEGQAYGRGCSFFAAMALERMSPIGEVARFGRFRALQVNSASVGWPLRAWIRNASRTNCWSFSKRSFEHSLWRTRRPVRNASTSRCAVGWRQPFEAACRFSTSHGVGPASPWPMWRRAVYLFFSCEVQTSSSSGCRLLSFAKNSRSLRIAIDSSPLQLRFPRGPEKRSIRRVC